MVSALLGAAATHLGLGAGYFFGPIVGCGACMASGALSGMLFLGPLLACATPVVGIFLIGTSHARRRP
jgi:hypothetical protein